VIATVEKSSSSSCLGTKNRSASVQAVLDRAARPFDKVTDLSFAEYIESTVMLDPDTEVTGGPYNLDENPFWRQILNDFVDHDVYEISVMKSTRVGGTLALVAAALGLSHYAPSPSMVAAPDESSMKELRNRIYSTAEASPAYRDQIPHERFRNMLHVDLERMKLYQAWSGSAQRNRGRTCRYVLRSEVDVWAAKTSKGGDPLKASAERVGRFYYSKIYSESTPDGDPSSIDTLWRQGNRCTWMCPCPHCGTFQELRFFPFKSGKHSGKGGIIGWQKKEGGLVKKDEAIERAYYRCVEGCRVDSHQKSDMVLNGIWVPRGQRIQVIRGKPVIKGTAEIDQRHSSYHLWKVHIPTITFGDLAGMYVDAYRSATLRNFFQDSLGRKNSTAKSLPGWKELGSRLAGTYKRGEVPEECWFLTAGADVQDQGVYWSVWGWGDRQTSWLIDWGYIPRTEGAEEYDDEGIASQEIDNLASDLTGLNIKVINRYFTVEKGLKNPLGKTKLRVRLANVDVNYRTRQVQEFVRSHVPYPEPPHLNDRVRTVRGKSTKMKDLFKFSEVDKPQAGGDPYAGGMQLWEINKDIVNEEMFFAMLMKRDVTGSMRFYQGITLDGEECLKQMSNERPSQEVNLKTGRSERIWKVYSELIGNHLWDCGGYARAAAGMELKRNDVTWDASTWEPVDVDVVQEIANQQYEEDDDGNDVARVR